MNKYFKYEDEASSFAKHYGGYINVEYRDNSEVVYCVTYEEDRECHFYDNNTQKKEYSEKDKQELHRKNLTKYINEGLESFELGIKESDRLNIIAQNDFVNNSIKEMVSIFKGAKEEKFKRIVEEVMPNKAKKFVAYEVVCVDNIGAENHFEKEISYLCVYETRDFLIVENANGMEQIMLKNRFRKYNEKINIKDFELVN